MAQEAVNAEEKTGVFQKIKEGKKPGKDQFVICILVGILLLVIGIPVSEKNEKETTKTGLLDNKSGIIKVEGNANRYK